MIRGYAYTFEAMTSPCEVLIYSEDKNVADSCAKRILEETKRLEKKYNYFDENSYLSQLNSRKISLLDVESKTLLQRAKGYYHDTQKVFDITLATIKDLYHDKQDIQSLKREKERLLPFVGCEHFYIKKDKLIFDNLHTKIDFGGFVKEYAVDRAVRILKKHKITSALVNFGGDIYALGKKPDGRKFSIGITNPVRIKEHIKTIEIANQALTTSASYERPIMIEDSIYSHILSKESSKRASSVSVISPSCVESGVYSTALMSNPTLEIKHECFIIP